jgi:hypothetical protein
MLYSDPLLDTDPKALATPLQSLNFRGTNYSAPLDHLPYHKAASAAHFLAHHSLSSSTHPIHDMPPVSTDLAELLCTSVKIIPSEANLSVCGVGIFDSGFKQLTSP